jgi:hypothetical protein
MDENVSLLCKYLRKRNLNEHFSALLEKKKNVNIFSFM